MTNTKTNKQANKNWFNAMVEFRWTIKNIMGTWNVPKAIAKDIQSGFFNQLECEMIVRESRILREQIGA